MLLKIKNSNVAQSLKIEMIVMSNVQTTREKRFGQQNTAAASVSEI